jgi:Bacterial Ig-like domain (group 3)/MBG domain (YGX type)
VSIMVTQAALTVASNSATRTYGTANPVFSGSVTGAVNGDTFSETFTTAATTSTNVGTYSIVPSVTGANLSDYAVSIQSALLTITQAATTTTLSVNSTTLTPGQSATFTAQVTSSTSGTPTGSVAVYDNNTYIGAAVLTAGSGTFTTSSLSAGATHTITALYSGDVNFASSSTTTSTSIAVAPLDFSFTTSGPTTQTVTPGGTAIYQIVVDPTYGNFAGTVSFSVTGLPSGATSSFNPSTISPTAGKQAVTLTIQTAAATAMQTRPSIARKLASLSLCLLLLPLAGTQRRRLTRTFVLLLLVGGVAATGALTGCGGHSTSSTQPQPQNYNITITASTGTLQHTSTVTLQVQ